MRAKLLGDLILGQSSGYINQSRAYITAWEYAKTSGEDFKTAVSHVLGAQSEHNKIEFLSMKEKIAERFENLGNPPEEYVIAHEKLRLLPDLYLNCHALILNPIPPREEYEKSIDEITKKIRDVGEEFYSKLGI